MGYADITRHEAEHDASLARADRAFEQWRASLTQRDRANLAGEFLVESKLEDAFTAYLREHYNDTNGATDYTPVLARSLLSKAIGSLEALEARYSDNPADYAYQLGQYRVLAKTLAERGKAVEEALA